MKKPRTPDLIRTAMALGAVLSVALALRHEFKPRTLATNPPGYAAGYVGSQNN